MVYIVCSFVYEPVNQNQKCGHFQNNSSIYILMVESFCNSEPVGKNP